jgi:DNA-binding MurR/RpiR family transcriptional regulator
MTRTLRERLTGSDLALTPSESRIVQLLLEDYPRAGLGTASSLARRASVSDPTVIRLVAKLGFKGFAAFQTRLLEEVDAALHSPLMMMEAKRPAAKGRSVAQAYLRTAAAAIEATAEMLLPQAYERAARIIMDARGRVLFVGGRFSGFVAGMLASYLAQFRPDVACLGPLSAESFDVLADLGERDVLVAFDYRRYQTDVVQFARQAAQRGTSIVLFTDPWRSPIAAYAKVTFVVSSEVGSPYDSLAPVVAQIEALLAHIIAQPSRAREERVSRIETIRSENAITLEKTADRP